MQISKRVRVRAPEDQITTTKSWYAKCYRQQNEFRSYSSTAYSSRISVNDILVRRVRSIRPRATCGRQQGSSRALAGIRNAIEAARSILELRANWDGEHAQPIDVQTWNRMTRFLFRYAHRLWQTERKTMDPPDITPVPNGTIDIHWDRPEFELLVNIPRADNDPAEFYGDDRGRISIKGEFDSHQLNEGLIHWLRKT